MKALILSGGKGTRLRPITHTSAKQLVPIANKPILFYGIESIAQAGITEIGIIVGETQQEIRQAVGDGSSWGVRVTYIEQEAPLGLAHAVKIAESFIGQDTFIMYLGDNLLRDGVLEFVREFENNKPQAQILLAKVDHPEQFGVAELENGLVKALEEKPEQPKSNLALVGVYLFDSHIFEAVNAIRPSKRNELEITDAIQYLIDKKYHVRSHIVQGWWKDTGKLEDLLEANRLVLESQTISIQGTVDADSKIEGKVCLEPGSQIIHSTIRGPAIIGKNTIVRNSYVGPYSSIYRDVVVENCEIEHSIVLENSQIKNISRIEDSLIGKNATLLKSPSKPSAFRIMIGDSSRIEIP